MRPVAALIALLPVALAVSGCGGSRALTHAELVPAADAVCSGTAREIAALPTPRTLRAAAAFATSAAKVLSGEVDALRRLRPAPPDASSFERFTASVEAAAEAMGQAADAASRADRAQFRQALRDGEDGAAAAATTARGLGLRVCGRPAVAAGP